MNNKKKQLIAIEVIRTLKSRFETFPNDSSNNRNAPFHEAFLNAFSDKLKNQGTSVPMFISLSSWIHGLNTTLGQSFFENIAHILSDGEKKDFKNLKISQEQQIIIVDIMTNLKNGKVSPNLQEENKLIFSTTTNPNKSADNFVVDCYYEDFEKIVCIELKTVKPNSGVFQKEKEKILSAKASLKNIKPEKEIHYFLAFPFDPTSQTPTGHDKQKYMRYSVDCVKFIDEREILLAGELWDFLSGEANTMEEIISIINTIATPNFIKEFEIINNPKNIFKESYKEILKKWFLFDELVIAENTEKLIIKAHNNNIIQKMLNRGIFQVGKKSDCKYDKDRKDVLLSSLS